MAPKPAINPQRKEALKHIIKKLHDGTPVEDMKSEFGELLKSCTPHEIAQIEEELIREGMPAEQVRELCDLHLEVFKESLEATQLNLKPNHPIWILMDEHSRLIAFTEELRAIGKTLKTLKDFKAATPHWKQLEQTVSQFRNSESHYIREENVLFPYLEKHGITQPPAIMWAEHDEIRAIEKQLYALIDSYQQLEYRQFTSQLSDLALVLSEKLAGHFHKENNILFPTGLKVITKNEWSQIRHEFDELGYTPFTSKVPPLETPEILTRKISKEVEGLMKFETGELTLTVIEGIFNSLPVDITFVDTEDTVRFYSESGGRIFPRSKAVIGRSVQACHPKQSVHKVQQILDDFRAGKRNVAEFWINLKGRMIYIRYFAVRNHSGEYQGCLEVTQDITDIQKITGEKRLLD
ncbi:MAG: DUF438 domain-containing protein [Candidatus Hermodarchaeota archaeon]